MASSSSTACAACKSQRRKCGPDCVFAPHFPAADPQRFDIVHEVFGASFVAKRLKPLPAKDRGVAAKCMVFDAKVYKKDRVRGCAGVIKSLFQENKRLKGELAQAKALISSYRQSSMTAVHGCSSGGQMGLAGGEGLTGVAIDQEMGLTTDGFTGGANHHEVGFSGGKGGGGEGFTSATSHDQMSMAGDAGATGLGEINPFHDNQVFFTNAANFNHTNSIANSIGQSGLVVDAIGIGGIGPLPHQEVGPAGAQAFPYLDISNQASLVVDGQVGANGVAPTGVDLFPLQPLGGDQDQATQPVWSFDEHGALSGFHAYEDGGFRQDQLSELGAWQDWSTFNPN